MLFYVATNGADNWSGKLDVPNADGTDGPFASIHRARNVIRSLKASGQLTEPVTVQIRGGRYPLIEPIVFEAKDSAPVTYMAYPDEQPIFDGGEQIMGWREEERNGQTIWISDLPARPPGKRYFRQLFVNGERRYRARLPKVGRTSKPEDFYRMVGKSVPAFEVGVDGPIEWQIGSYEFRCRTEDMQQWENLEDVEIVALHRWIESRLPLVSYDPQTGMTKSSRCSLYALVESRQTDVGARYYIDNVLEGLTEAGEWYLDRSIGRLYYLPMPDETLDEAEIYAPRSTQLLKIVGTKEQPVEFLRYEGLVFEHGAWEQPQGGTTNRPERTPHRHPDWQFGGYHQAAIGVPGTVSLEYAQSITLTDCTVRHIGWYGIELGIGCCGIHITRNTIYDLGAGGIKLIGANYLQPREKQNGLNTITDNHIYDGGHVFHSAVGILAEHSFGNIIAHNHIHHFYYSGVSCGWVWGYGENISRDNLIAYNHIHDLGFYWLDDMGGIYTLGVQPGTVLRGNLIHDVYSAVYGGRGLYPDEGSSHMLIEQNIVYNTSHEAFNQHYGRENIVRNNIFAFGKRSQVGLLRLETEHLSFTAERNILVTRDSSLFAGGYSNSFESTCHMSDLNLFWSVTDSPLLVEPSSPQTITLDEWRSMGHDHHSIIADPKFADIEQYNFTLTDDSPAFELGFVPIDASRAGIR